MFEVEEDPERESHMVKITIDSTIRTKKVKITNNFVDSAEFSGLINHYDGINSFLNSNFIYATDKINESFVNLDEFADFVIATGKQGAYIQRYKGLGEMNPDQLWDTTMDPENRTLLQVKIEDTIDADMVFSVLMGDAVEPRREFVESNALNVRNLDV